MIIRFKTSILMSSLCDYCDAYILVKRTIKKKQLRFKQIMLLIKIFKNCASFNNCINRIISRQVDNGS